MAALGVGVQGTNIPLEERKSSSDRKSEVRVIYNKTNVKVPKMDER